MSDKNLSFEQVLSVFADYLSKDDIVEVIKTSRGYVALQWDDRMETWAEAEHCATPDSLKGILLGTYTNHLEFQYTLGKRELTPEERESIVNQVKVFSEKNK